MNKYAGYIIHGSFVVHWIVIGFLAITHGGFNGC